MKINVWRKFERKGLGSLWLPPAPSRGSGSDVTEVRLKRKLEKEEKRKRNCEKQLHGRAHELVSVERLFWKRKVGLGCPESGDSSSRSKFSKLQPLNPVNLLSFPSRPLGP